MARGGRAGPGDVELQAGEVKSKERREFLKRIALNKRE
jgi:hypothetical protein